MIKTRDELLEALKGKLGDDTSDETLALIEDVSDTLTDYETKTKDSTDWKAKYEEKDKEWRQKYRDRFFKHDAKDEDEGEAEQDEPKTVEKFEDLFTEKEK